MTSQAKKSDGRMTSQFLTYNSKLDAYNMPQAYLAYGSRNVLINALFKVKAREGYVLQSAVGTSGSTIQGSVEWANSTGANIPIRCLQNEALLQAYLNGSWENLMEGLTALAPSFDAYWDDTQKIDRLMWVDGTADAKDWSGAVATLSSITAATVTCQGAKTFGQQRFLLSSTRAIRIKDDNGVWRRTAYTGGESTTILTGLGTDLTAYPFSGGNLIVQEVITRTSLISSTFYTDWLRVVNNQVIVGSRVSNDVYVSKNTSPTDFAFSTPRLTGEGMQFTLDGPSRGLGVLRGDIILFAGTGLVYMSQFQQITVGSTLAETVKIVQIKTTDLQGAQHNELIAQVSNGLMWVGHDNVLYELLDASLSYNPDLRPVSDPIKTDMDAADFGLASGNWGHLRFNKTRLYLSAPASAVCFIYEYVLNEKLQREWFWQPPLTLPVKRWAVISSAISGHSSSASETYTLFTGFRDGAASDGSGGGPIDCRLLLGRWNGGVRDELKDADEFFLEGAATPNCNIAITFMFDLDGGEQQNIYRTYSPGNDGNGSVGTQQQTVYTTVQDPSLGNLELGDPSISGDILATTLPHFRVKVEQAPLGGFFDYGLFLETNDFDQQWELMCVSSNASLSTNRADGIKI